MNIGKFLAALSCFVFGIGLTVIAALMTFYLSPIPGPTGLLYLVSSVFIASAAFLFHSMGDD